MDLILIITRLNTQLDTAMVERSIDKGHLSYIIGILLGVPIVRQILSYERLQIGQTLRNRIRAHYEGRTFEAYARVDVLAYKDPFIWQQLNDISDENVLKAWESLQTLTELFSTIVLLVSQVSVLFTKLHEQKDGLIIAAVCCFSQIMSFAYYRNLFNDGSTYTQLKVLSYLTHMK